MAAWGEILLAVDAVVLAIFVVEILLRLYVHRLRFFRDPWSLFDFTIVAIALVPASGPFQVLRALRILRVLRLISVVPSLRRVVAGLIAALPGMGSIIMLLAIVFYVASVMATELFGEAFPEWFGTIGASAYSLFQIMTLESWSMGIVRPVMEEFPYAWAFFVPFILMTTFVVLNLFIGVVVSAMQETVDEAATENRKEIASEGKAVTAALAELRQEVRDLRAAMERRV
jgi:voltage-gated sodium channel